MASADGDTEAVEEVMQQASETTEAQTENKADDGAAGDEVNGKEEEESGPIGTYAVIPEDPPQAPLGPPNALEKKIIKQVEYYFGDMNLPRDRFLQEQIREDPDGWVSLAIMTKFNRLKQLTSNLNMIATALRKADSGLLEVSKDSVYVRRSPEKPLPQNTEDRRHEVQRRSVYAKGFPTNASLDKIISFFEGEHGLVDTVYMRRDINKKFKGSVFAVFQEESDAEKFVGAANIKFQDIDLLRLTKSDYFSKKQAEKKQRKQEELDKKNEEEKKKHEEDRERLKTTISRGCVLHMEGITGETERDDLRTYFSDFGTVAWVDFNTGDKEAWVRFQDENKAVEALQAAKDANEGKVVIKEDELTCNVLEGDEELEHWRKIFQEQAEKRASIKKGGRKRKSGPWKGPKEKRKRDDDGGSGDDSEDDD